MGYVLAGTVFGVLGFGIIDGAAAQEIENYVPTSLSGYDVMPGVTVESRFHPEYEPLGIQLGSIILHPSATQSLGYDQNVLGTPDAHGSTVVNTQGSLQAATDWSRNSLQLNLDVDRFGYSNLPAQTYTNWSAGGGWSYEIGRDVLGLGVSHYQLNQLPSGIDSIGLIRPLPYQTDTVRLSYKASRGPWTFVPLVDFSNTRFDNSSNQIGTSQQAGLNRDVEAGSITAFYEFAPQRSVVVVVRETTAQYQAGLPRPDYNDVSALTGLDYNPTGLIHFRALAGYEVRSYQNSQFQNHSAPVVEAKVIWTPTGLTTVTGTVTRRIEDANESVHTGYTYTQARLVVDHEYLRNVILQGRASIENAAYLGGGDEQTLFGAGASATYILNRNLRLSATYDYTHSNLSSGGTTIYTRNVFLLQLRLTI